MPIVIRQGKRYRLSFPYTGERYQIMRYGPAPDAAGQINEKDLMLIIIDEVNGFSIECDEQDAEELESLISSHNIGTLTFAQFEQALAGFVQATFANHDVSG